MSRTLLCLWALIAIGLTLVGVTLAVFVVLPKYGGGCFILALLLITAAFSVAASFILKTYLGLRL